MLKTYLSFNTIPTAENITIYTYIYDTDTPGRKILKMPRPQSSDFQARIFLLTVNKDLHRIYYILL